MSNQQNKIDNLIANLCPGGVVLKQLGEIARIRHGKDYKSLGNGQIPVYGSGGIMTYVDTYSYDKPTVLIPRKGSITNIFYVEKPFWNVDTIYYTEIDTQVLIPKFFYYFMKTVDLLALDTGSGRPSLTMEILNKLRIPIPPLAVQKEIVKILNSFIELEAELEARKKQYDHYRTKLLTFKDNVRYATLGEVMTIVRGASPRPIQSFLTKNIDGVNWIKIGDVNPGAKFVTQTSQKITPEGAKKSRFLKKGDFILSNSMSFGRPYIMGIDGCIHDGWIAMSAFEKNFIPDFLYHLLRSNIVQKYWQQKASSGTVQNLNADIVRGTNVPVPSLEEQKVISDLLDKFDTLVNDISVGLPSELNARRSQYEYYRNKLLSFKEYVG